MKKATFKLDCGCVVETLTDYLVSMCDACETEWEEHHAKAAEDRNQAETAP